MNPILSLLINLVLTPITVALAALLGYFFGVLIAYIPFINDLLTDGFGIEHGHIPVIMAWIYVLVIVNQLYRSKQNEGGEKK